MPLLHNISPCVCVCVLFLRTRSLAIHTHTRLCVRSYISCCPCVCVCVCACVCVTSGWRRTARMLRAGDVRSIDAPFLVFGVGWDMLPGRNADLDASCGWFSWVLCCLRTLFWCTCCCAPWRKSFSMDPCLNGHSHTQMHAIAQSSTQTHTNVFFR